MKSNNPSNSIDEMFDRAVPLWSEEEIAKLFELNPEVDTSVTGPKIQDEVIMETFPPSVNLRDDEESGELGITAQDLIESDDNPHNNSTKPTFSGNPFAKFGAVGLMMAVLFAMGAIFLNGVMNTPIGRAPSSTKESAKESVATPSNSDGSENEIGELKTQLALGRQSEQLEDWSQRRREAVPTAVESPETLPGGEQDAEERSDLPEPEVTSISPRPSSPPAPSPPPPAVRPVQSVRPATPRTEPIREPEPIPEPEPIRKPEPIREPEPIPEPEPIREPEPIQKPEPIREPEPILESQRGPVPEAIDPMQQYALLGALGSYGQISVPEMSHLEDPSEVASVDDIPIAELVQPSSEGSQLLPEEQNILAAAPRVQPLPEEQNILTAKPVIQDTFQLANAPDEMGITFQANQLQTEAGVKSSSAGRVAPALLNGTLAQNQLQIGRSLSGELLTSVWVNPSEGSSNLFVVKLTAPLSSTDGTVLFPVGTRVIFEAKAIASNGVVEATAIALVDGHQEYRLPPSVLSIQGEDGQPLIARQRSASSQGIANRDARAFAVGALAQVGDVLSQPDVMEQFSSSGSFSSTQYSRSQRRGGWQSITGATLSGGLGALSQRLEERERLALEQLEQQSPLWMVEAGTPVTLFVHGTFQFR
ncbi:TrbI/VirB10 family protein [Laspinema sp. D1]|uniref:TrbI/VirB10 family protein n=1 Tax=Laspinema palackyanum D2a TaxID=2953684 RepID=A0ABT2MV52_9CYAN|nr:TrbI/VirB10 family protein [Laspinema sp. D2a]